MVLILAGLAVVPGLADANGGGLATTPWPMFHNNLQHTGLSLYTGPSDNTTRWTYTTTGGVVRSSPAIGSDGTIYVGSWNWGLYAIDSNGDRKWSYNAGIRISSSPAIGSDDTIYFGDYDGKLNAITDNITSCSLKWFYDTGGSIGISSPAIGSDGTIYVGLQIDDGEGNVTGRLYAINPDGSLKWFYATPGVINDSSPAISLDGKTIYIGAHDGNLYAISDNGTFKWSFHTGSWIDSSPAIDSYGTIYIGSDDWYLYAITDNVTSGIQKWSFRAAGDIDSSPAIGSDGTIYVGSLDYTLGGGNLNAINPSDGSLKWSFHTTDSIHSSPAIDKDGIIYVGSNDHRVYAINPDGSQKWRYTTGNWVISSPAIGSDGTLYIGSEDQKIYAFGSSPRIASVIPNSGTQGHTLNNVIITGNNFTSVTNVSFGTGIAVIPPIITDNSTQIRVNLNIAADATPGARDVSVTNLDGTTGTKRGCFTVQPPLPIVYVNGTTGNNSYDGSSPVYTPVSTGPKKTIEGGIDAVSDNGTVNVAAGTYHEHGLHLSETMNLVGAGALTTIIDGGAQGRVIEVSSAPFQRNTISGFTIQNGAATVTDFGGGIYISQSHIVTINDCAIINNTKVASIDHETNWGVGAGICNDGGVLYMNRCTVSGNTALFSGGGIFTIRTFEGDSGLVELTDCTISGNSVTASDGQGGGIWNSGTLTISRCCISGNHACRGSGIYTMPAFTATLTNCTISGNTGIGVGGGIRNWGIMRCYNVTISENHGSVGGGFSNDGAPARMYFKNCIVAGNTADDGIHNNGASSNVTGIQSQGYNIDSENSCYFTDSTDQRNTNPLLGTLQNNGGPTSTHAITASSPAFNTGTSVGAPATDQRGVARPQAGAYDIGAFELELIQAPVVASVSPNSGNQGQTLNNVIVTGSNFTGATVVSFGSGITTNSFTVNSATQITASITIGAGATPGASDVLVTTPGGTGTLPNGFTVLQPTRSVNTATGTGIATFTTSSGSITALTAANSTPCGTLAGFSFPHGFFSFTIGNISPGSTVTITITLPSNMPTDTQYWKCINGQWVNATSILGDNDGDNILTLTITDGSQFDADGQVNGIIVDPGAPAVPGATVPAPAAHRESPTTNPLKPAQMSVQYLSVNTQQAAANQPVTITINVVNTGGEAGNLNVALKINGQVEQTKTVSVGPQGTQPVKFTVTKAQPGTYTVDIGGQKGSFTVLVAGATAPAPASESLIAILIVVALIIATAVVLLFIFRRFAR